MSQEKTLTEILDEEEPGRHIPMVFDESIQPKATA